MPHDEAPESGLAVSNLDLAPAPSATPTLKLSAAIYCSGGAIWAKGYGGTYTRLAAS